MKNFHVEVGQFVCDFRIHLASFKIVAETPKDAIIKVFELANKYKIDDPVIMSMMCEDIIYDF